jgi:hypothetical protein
MSLVACGGGGKKTTPDASQQDASPDAKSCTTLTAPSGSDVDLIGYSPNSGIAVGGPGGDAGDGNPLNWQVEVYSGIESSLVGTFDLSSGKFNNYKTCAVCVFAYSVDDQGAPIKEFFQSGGSVTIAADPFTDGHLVASFSNVTMQEVTVADDYTSTPVANGLCTTYGNFNVDHTKAPNAYTTCPYTTWEDGTCDCTCGGGGSGATPDPDCETVRGTINGCTTGQTCYTDDTCQTAPANDQCAAAIPLVIGTAVTGTTVNAANNYEAGLDGATCDGVPEQGPDVAYSVVLTAGQSITVTLSGLDTGFDGGVALIGPGAASICDANPIATCVKGADANTEGMDETFTYTTDATTGAGTYYILVDSFYPNEAGAFTLKVTSN